MAAKKIAPAQGARLDDWSPQLLKSRLYGQLLVDIIIGRLAPGERLDEQALAQRYDGGLAGIREALAQGAVVADHKPVENVGPFFDLFRR